MSNSFINNSSSDQIDHFQKLIKLYGKNHKALSSESLDHKRCRYEQISKIFEGDRGFTIHDIGSGFGDYLRYLIDKNNEITFEYSGSDIVPEFIEECKNNFPKEYKFYLRDLSEKIYPEKYDYVVMSGVFHQMRNTKMKEWEEFAYNLIGNAFKMSKKGLAFNFVSPYVDFHKENIYYCDLTKLINMVTHKFTRFFEINHSYPLYEFTFFMYHESKIKEENYFKNLDKYLN